MSTSNNLQEMSLITSAMSYSYKPRILAFFHVNAEEFLLLAFFAMIVYWICDHRIYLFSFSW